MISFLKTAYRLGTLNDCSILYSFPKSPVHQGAETGGTGAFGGNGNVDSWTVPHVGQVTWAFSSICSWLWPAIPSRNAVNVGPQSLQRSAVFSSVIVVLPETPNRLSATSRAMGVESSLIVVNTRIHQLLGNGPPARVVGPGPLQDGTGVE